MLNFSQSYSQQYIPFPDRDAYWAAECCSGYQCEIHWGYSFSAATYDTILNGYTYHVAGNNFYYRNDTVKKQVLAYYPIQDLEVIWYDFGLAIGDTFRIRLQEYDYDYCEDTVFIYQGYNTIKLNNNEIRKKHFFDGINSYSSFEAIEGIGSVNGLSTFFTYCFETSCALCFQQNDTFLYGWLPACHYVSNVNENENDSKILCNVSPNPTRGFSIVKSKKQIEEIEVINILGKNLSSPNKINSFQ